MSNKTISNKIMFSFVHLQPIRWNWRALPIALLFFTTTLPIFAQTITVTSPDGDEIWEVGSTQTITWTSTGTVGKVKIEYSTDNGISWKNVKASTDNTGSYSWTIPDDPSTNCLVKVSEKDGDPSDTSDAIFAIIGLGGLHVVINPQEAIDAGAKWKLASEDTWHGSGETVSYSPSDDYTLEFKPIPGWSKPSDKSVKIKTGQTTYESGAYNKIYNGELRFVIDKKRVTVPEGETDTFKVKLSGKPLSYVVVTVSKTGGDVHITVISGSELTFNPDNWNKFQTVTLEAAEDDDVIDGEAIIQIRAAGVEDEDITAVEQDNDISDIYLKLNPHTGTTGNIIKISIDISNNTLPISSFGLNFIYDSNLFTLKSIKKGCLTSDWSTIGGEEEPPGTITIVGIAGGGQAIYEDSQGTLVRIWLKVKCDSFTTETESDIRIENYLGDIEGFSPYPCTADITLVPCPRVGDVNSDGDLTPGDAQNTLEIYLGKRAPEFCQKTTSDSNGDESTTPGDAQDIFDCYLGRKELPECHDESAGTSSSSSFSSLKRARDKKRLRPYKPKLFTLNTIGYSGKTVNIPIIITNPEGVSSFSFEVNYVPELLEYTGIRRSQLTNEFDYVRGIEEIEGLIRVEGESKQPIKYNKYASLAVLAFRVKEGVNGSLPIILFNPGKDLFNVEIDDGTFLGLEYFDEQTRFLSLGKATIRPDRTLRIPVKVSSAFNIKSFGLEIKYPKEKMLFIGINRGELTNNFTAVEGNELEPGVVRVGGYSMSGIQERKPGILVEIVFLIKEMDGKIEIVKLVDDIQDFIIQKRRIRMKEKRDRGKKLWFLKSYGHR